RPPATAGSAPCSSWRWPRSTSSPGRSPGSSWPRPCSWPQARTCSGGGAGRRCWRCRSGGPRCSTGCSTRCWRYPCDAVSVTGFVDGTAALLDPTAAACFGGGLLVGTLVGLFPGVTGSMAVALASGFTLTLEPVQGLAVLLTIYVGANYGDRIPSILVNTPGTPAAIATTFDGYPMARQGRAGL